MTDVTITPITSGYQSTNALNTNFNALASAIQDCLNKEGGASNQMNAPLDMNGYSILNAVYEDAPDVNLGWDSSLNTITNTQGQDVQIPVATSTSAGLMGAADKSAIDSLSTSIDQKADINHTHPVSDLEQGTGTEGQVPTLAPDGSVLWANPPGAGGGESNTIVNVGTGSGWYKQKVGSELQLKSVLAGNGVAVSVGVDELTISSTLSESYLLDRANHTGTQTLSTISDSGTAASKDVPSTGDASSTEVVLGDDSRLSDARTPTAHTHTVSDIDSGTATAGYAPIADGSGGVAWEAPKDTTETVYTASSGAFDRANGGIQLYTLTANETVSITINSGQSFTLHLSGGATYTVTWPMMTWVGGSAPTLTATDVIEFWKVGTTLYGAYVGSVA